MVYILLYYRCVFFLLIFISRRSSGSTFTSIRFRDALEISKQVDLISSHFMDLEFKREVWARNINLDVIDI